VILTMWFMLSMPLPSTCAYPSFRGHCFAQPNLLSSSRPRSIFKATSQPLSTSVITIADVTNRKGASVAFSEHRESLSAVMNVLVDGGYTGQPFADTVHNLHEGHGNGCQAKRAAHLCRVSQTLGCRALVCLVRYQVPCNYILRRSYPLLQAREVLRLLTEEGAEGTAKTETSEVGRV